MARIRQLSDKAEIVMIALVRTLDGYVPEIHYTERSYDSSGKLVGEKPGLKEIVRIDTDLLTPLQYENLRQLALRLETIFLQARFNE